MKKGPHKSPEHPIVKLQFVVASHMHPKQVEVKSGMNKSSYNLSPFNKKTTEKKSRHFVLNFYNQTVNLHGMYFFFF